MSSIQVPGRVVKCLPGYSLGSSGINRRGGGGGFSFVCKGRSPILTKIWKRNRYLSHADHHLCKSRSIIYSALGDSDEISANDLKGDDSAENQLIEAEKALSEVQGRQESIEKERDRLLEELKESEAKHQEYMAAIMRDKELAISELEAARSMFDKKMQESSEEKFKMESKLILAKQDAVELAVQVEELAGITFQQATAHMIEDAQLRISAAETSAAEAAYHVEEQIRNATEGAIASIIEQSNKAIEKALSIAERASDHSAKAATTFTNDIITSDDISSSKSLTIELKNSVNDLESRLLLAGNEINKLKLELDQTDAQVNVFKLRADEAEKMFLEFQESCRKKALQQEEEISLLMEKVKKDAEDTKMAASNAFKVELESIKAALSAVKETVQSKDQIHQKRCEIVQRSLKASEATANKWKARAEIAESFLLKTAPLSEEDRDTLFVANGGRADLFMVNDPQKWKLLTDGPRREIPDWTARKIRSVSLKLPPKKLDLSEALKSKYKSLELPKLDEVWSIAHEIPKEGDTLVEHIIEKDIIEKKRKTLEHVLEKKTIQWQGTPELKKLEPGTGTGREIVFQGFNWESWRRKWYLEMASKASDLSKCGITSVWLPPPTESVAPQGYMPSDLYNLNSAYGTKDELKYCIEEMHNHQLMALGDVVLNHRCAHKQSPNGVWNIFGGKLAWGPEAIVCDDPNFQGRGNPSSGDIFHAAPNIDHSQEFVRKDIKEWLNWLKNDIGFDGWRLDFVRGFSGEYVKEYIESSNPAFSIGEYWDSLAYEGDNLCYNQDAHRQRIVDWINATGGTSSAFDVTTKGILHSALHNEYWRLIDPQGKPTGVMGWWPSRAITFLENHDTGSTQGHWPFPREKLPQGYAYILTHPGTPTIFYDHFYDFGLRETINELLEARRRGGVHCRSGIKIFHANNDGYVGHVGDNLVLKIGHFDWNPSKEINLDGSWQKFIDRGSDYQIWLRE
ncbi:uncharacterized protein LOC124923895 [Impatiens glandulifera]|uniref:uncharacterized protein LOC124923895 n=1 Tax=Impatiens glandulifera TaxID=253017 RepID=UPI001FB188DD|nr:uncharacterized protein LOC124923895 [Impatiens glandulifera]